MAFDTAFNRSNADDREARELPEEVVSQIIDDAEQTSVALQLGNVRRMNAYQTRFRLLNSVPEAYWINGTAATDKPAVGPGSAYADGTQQAKDFSLKQTTAFGWDNAYLTPDEIAVMVVMPDNWRDDSDIVWEEIRTKLRTAFAKKIDNAIFYGRGGVPASFGDGIVFDTVAAGNVVTAEESATPGENDLVDDFAELGQHVELRGYELNGYIVGPAEKWTLRRMRDGNGLGLLSPLTAGGDPGLFGVALEEVRNGIWDRDAAIALAGDFQQLHIGIRQDMTFAMSNTAVIRDQAGNVLYSAFQQDGEVLRAVMRLGYVVTDPYKHLTGEREYPFSVLREAASADS